MKENLFKKHEDAYEADYYILHEEQYKDFGFSNDLFDIDIEKYVKLYKEAGYTV